jgi:hypothetical protein
MQVSVRARLGALVRSHAPHSPERQALCPVACCRRTGSRGLRILRDMDPSIRVVLGKLEWMRAQGIWPTGLRYLWTDAFGVVLLTSLAEATGQARYLDQAEALVEDVDRVLGRPGGYRIGQAEDRGGQYFHYLAMWIYALGVLGGFRPGYRERAVQVVKHVHPRFVVPGKGVIWKMEEDLSGPYPGYGLGAMDAFDGYVVYRLLQAPELEPEIAELKGLMDQTCERLVITQDLGVGIMLWLSHFFPDEPWAVTQRRRCLAVCEDLWVEPPGYFCRQPGYPHVRFAFTNYGLSLGLQAVGEWTDRVQAVNAYFETWRSGDAYDTDAITHVMACTSWFPGLFLDPRRLPQSAFAPI